MMRALDGYKTYIVAATIIGVGIYLNATGQIDGDKLVELVLEGLGLGALRHGISTKL